MKALVLSFALALFGGLSGALAVALLDLGTPASRVAAAMVSQEQALCQATMPGTDCGCFARKAQHILSDQRLQGVTTRKAKPLDLAYSQAARACS